MVRDSLKGDFRSPCEIVSQRSELRIPLFFFMGISSNKSSPKVVVKKWWFTYGTKHKESPKSSDKSFPRCNNFAASEMRLRRAKALPTCENSRKKNRPPVGWWLKNSVILYSFYLETPNKKSGERKKHTWKINIYLALNPLPIEDGSVLHFAKRTTTTKRLDFERMVSERTWCWNHFPVSFVKPVCLFAETSVEEYKFHLIFPPFCFLNETAVDGLTNGPPKSRYPLFSGYIPYESEIRIWIQTYFPTPKPPGLMLSGHLCTKHNQKEPTFVAHLERVG